MRHLDILHAIASLERARLVVTDQLTPDIGRLLENARDVAELAAKISVGPLDDITKK